MYDGNKRKLERYSRKEAFVFHWNIEFEGNVKRRNEDDSKEGNDGSGNGDNTVGRFWDTATIRIAFNATRFFGVKYFFSRGILKSSLLLFLP